MKILSVSIAAYNAAQYLDKCIHSFVNSSVADKVELIIVNDGSNDNTLVVAQELAKSYPDTVKVIDKENGGYGSTINVSIPVATGKYYKVVDADDWVDRDGIEKLVNFLETSNSDIVINPFNKVDATTGEIYDSISVDDGSFSIAKTYNIDDLSGVSLRMHAITYKTEVLKKSELVFDENCYYVDEEYVVFPLIDVKSFVVLDFPVYMYFWGLPEQSMNIKNLLNRRDQYQRVTMRLIDYYAFIVNKNISGSLKEQILDKVHSNVLFQYNIFTYLPCKASKKEAILFDNAIKHTSKSIYRGNNKKHMKIIRFHRKTGFVFYRFVLWILKKTNNLPRV